MARWGTVNKPQVISITHWDGRIDLYPMSYVYSSASILIASVPLVHKALGYYAAIWTPVVEDQYTIVTIVYTNAGHTILDEETQREGEIVFINSIETDIENLPSTVASDVWDEVLPGNHDLPFTSGLFMQVIRETTLQTNWEVKSDPAHSLAQLENKILGNRLILTNEINENEVKIEALTLQSSSQYLDTVNEILINRADISLLDGNLNTTRTQIINEINENEVKIDAVFSAIQQIQNNTRFVAVVPPIMIRPGVGTKRYQFFLAIYDDIGNPEAPDSLPTIRMIESTGGVVLPESNMTADGVKVGQYYYNFDLNAGSSTFVLRIEFKVVENVVTRYISRVSEVREYDTTLQDIENKIDIIDTVVDSNYALLTGGNGLSVLFNRINTAISDIQATDAKVTLVKNKTDLIVSNPATTSDVTFLSSQILSRPSISDIQARLDIQTSSIKGPMGYNLTDVFNNERGTDNALLSNDPRLNFLDVAVSSRSGFSVADIWSYVTRTLTTSQPLSNTDVAKIWDYLTANITTNGSIGKYILDYLNAPVSTRSTLTLAQLTSALAPLALEATLSVVQSSVVNEANENQILINQALALLNLIKPQTDKIVNDGAQQTSVINEINQNQSLIQALTLLAQSIKVKTDTIPPDTARQSSLLLIPTNPLLNNDGRLTYLYNLDVPVSTRATSFPLDYAKEVTLVNTRNDVLAELVDIGNEISLLPTESFIIAQLTRLDNILTELSDIQGASFTPNDSLVAIRDAIDDIIYTCPTITPEDVWTYGTRTLTSYPETTTPSQVESIVNSAFSSNAEFRCNMTTTFITLSDVQEVLCWLDRSGQTLANTSNARIEVSNGIVVLWSGSSLAPDPRGVFRITHNNISATIDDADLNFVIKITINYLGSDYTTVQPFYTVG